MLTVEASRTTNVASSAFGFALELFKTLPRVAGIPYCFAKRETLDRWRYPDGPLKDALSDLNWDWLEGGHDFRHFRATQWIVDGIDIRTVQGLLGHSDLATTMRQAEQRQLARMEEAAKKQATNRQQHLPDVNAALVKLFMRKGGLEPAEPDDKSTT